MGRPRKTVDELKRSGNYRPSRHEGRVAARESGETPTDPVGSGASKELVAAPSSTMSTPNSFTGNHSGGRSRSFGPGRCAVFSAVNTSEAARDVGHSP